MKFQLKTFLGFMMLVSIVTIFGVLLTFQVNSLNPIVDRLNKDLEDFNTAEELEQLIFEINILRFESNHDAIDFILSSEVSHQQKYKLASEQLMQKIDIAIKKSDNEIDRKIFEALRESNAELQNIENEMFNLMEQNKIEQASALFVGEEYESLEEDFELFITKFFNNKQYEANDSFSKLIQISAAVTENSLVLKDLSQIVLISLVLIIGLSILLSILLSRSISSPVRKLRDVTDEISKGNLNVQTDVKSSDELGDLSQSINQMAKIIKQNQEQIKKQLAELHEIDKQKEEFASMVTHELKTPLSPIMLYCELLKDKSLGELGEEQLVSVNEIYRNTERLDRLIGDILDAQKLSMDTMSFNKQIIATAELLDKVIKDFSITTDDKQIEFVNSNFSKSTIFADEDRITQVMENLIQNSLDFVPEKNGRIEIGARDEDSKVIFYVKDNGAGIPKDKQANLFKKFYQVDTSHRREHGGSGLGLVICKGIIENLGGSIWFESEEGKGANFYFSLPKKLEENVKIV